MVFPAAAGGIRENGAGEGRAGVGDNDRVAARVRRLRGRDGIRRVGRTRDIRSVFPPLVRRRDRARGTHRETRTRFDTKTRRPISLLARQ